MHYGFCQHTRKSEEGFEIARRLTEDINIDCRLSGDFPQTQPVGPGGAGCSHPDFIHPARSARRPVYAHARSESAFLFQSHLRTGVPADRSARPAVQSSSDPNLHTNANAAWKQ